MCDGEFCSAATQLLRSTSQILSSPCKPRNCMLQFGFPLARFFRRRPIKQHTSCFEAHGSLAFSFAFFWNQLCCFPFFLCSRKAHHLPARFAQAIEKVQQLWTQRDRNTLDYISLYASNKCTECIVIRYRWNKRSALNSTALQLLEPRKKPLFLTVACRRHKYNISSMIPYNLNKFQTTKAFFTYLGMNQCQSPA